jgi:hypothetical protein
VLHEGKVYTNAPAQVGGADNGGIRPSAMADYYKAAFGLAREGSVRPWLARDDAVNKRIFTFAHDDLGQDADYVYEKYQGKAGVYLNPSRIAGDGFRYRAQVSFWPAPASASHPNQEALLRRYSHPPSGNTAGLRVAQDLGSRLRAVDADRDRRLGRHAHCGGCVLCHDPRAHCVRRRQHNHAAAVFAGRHGRQRPDPLDGVHAGGGRQGRRRAGGPSTARPRPTRRATSGPTWTRTTGALRAGPSR